MKSSIRIIMLIAGLTAIDALASTQEYLGVVESGSGASAAVKTVTVMYVSHEVSPGTFEMFDPNEGCLFMINDAFCTREAFLAAVQPGRRLYCRGNRSKGMFYGLYTTPFFEAEGVIESVDGSRFTVTHKPCYRDCTPSTVSRTVSAEAGAVVRYEGRDVGLAEALAVGRHVRVSGARTQIVQVLSTDAWIEDVTERTAAWPWTKEGPEEFIWGNEGYLRGVTNSTMMFAAECLRCTPASAGEYIDTYQRGEIDEPASLLIDGQYAPAGAALRAGRRCLFVPDRVVDYRSAYKTFVQAGDDGVIEGRLKSVEGSSIVLETITCPSGRGADLTRGEVTVTLDGDAAFHLDGIPGASKSAALQPGSFVRVLPAWTRAILVRDIDLSKATLSGNDAAVQPWFVEYTPSLTVTEFETAQLFAAAAGYPTPSVSWRRDGAPLESASGDTYRFIPALSDDGTAFRAVAENSAGSATTPDIVVTVLPDTEPPSIANAFTAGQTRIVVVFSKTVSKESAEAVGNYTLGGGLSVSGATLQSDGRTVYLDVSSMTRDESYTLTVDGVEDIAATPNTIAANSTIELIYGVTFRYLKFTVTKRAGSFSSELCELRFVAGGEELGTEALYSGQLSDGEPAELFDGSTSGGLRWNEGSYVEVDFGAGNDIAPEAVRFHTCSDGRYVGGVKVEGSKDGASWIELVSAEDTFDGGRWHTLAIDLSHIDPNDVVANRRGGLRTPQPHRASQPVPVQIYTLSGRLVAKRFQAPGAPLRLPRLEAGTYIVRRGTVATRRVVVVR